MAGLFEGLGQGLGAVAGGYLAGKRQGEAERYRREQIALQRQDRLAREKALLGFRKEQLTALGERDTARLAGGAEKDRRAFAGRYVQAIDKVLLDTEKQADLNKMPWLKRHLQDERNSAMAIITGTRSQEDWQPQHDVDARTGGLVLSEEPPAAMDMGGAGILGQLNTAAAGGGIPFAPATTRPENQGFPEALLRSLGRMPGVDLGGGRVVSPPDFPELAPGTTFASPGGGTFIPSAPGAAPGPVADPYAFETVTQREKRLIREAKEEAAAAKAPLTAAQAEFARQRALELGVKIPTIPTEARSKQLLRERQGRKAAAEAGAIPGKARAQATTAGAAARRAQTDAERQREQARHNRAVEADRARRTHLQGLKDWVGRQRTVTDIKRLREGIRKAGGQMSDVDRKAWDFWSKRATRSVRGDFGKETIVDDPEAQDQLDKLARKYGRRLTTDTGEGTDTGGGGTATVAPPKKSRITPQSLAYVKRAISERRFGIEYGALRKTDPDAAELMALTYQQLKGRRPGAAAGR